MIIINNFGYDDLNRLTHGGTETDFRYFVYGQMLRLNPDFTAFSGTEAGNPYYFTGRELDSMDGGNCKLW
jgi:hypothetical protein